MEMLASTCPHGLQNNYNEKVPPSSSAFLGQPAWKAKVLGTCATFLLLVLLI